MVTISEYYKISTEYNAVDIPRMISKKATDKIRSLTSHTVVKIDNLDKLVDFYTGKLTTIGEFINILDPIRYPIEYIYKGVLATINILRNNTSKSSYDDELPKDKKELSKTYLSYYQFFINVKNINWNQPSDYKNVNTVTHTVIEELLDTSIKNKWRDATPLEIHKLKIFRPDKIRKEMEEAIKIMKEKSSQVNKQDEWITIYNTAASDANRIMDFILKNISDTEGIVKFKE